MNHFNLKFGMFPLKMVLRTISYIIIITYYL